jgi:hypothetical protein
VAGCGPDSSGSGQGREHDDERSGYAKGGVNHM